VIVSSYAGAAIFETFPETISKEVNREVPMQQDKARAPVMSQETGNAILDIVNLLWARSFESYLSSPAFITFLQDHELCDEWRKYLELARDKPALYGNSVGKFAFTRFLEHLHHHLPGQFPFLFFWLLADFSGRLPCDLPVDDIRLSLLELGYPAEKIDPALMVLKRKLVPDPER
jgi:hypothetical protein